MGIKTKIEFKANQSPPISSWLGFWKKPLLEVDIRLLTRSLFKSSTKSSGLTGSWYHAPKGGAWELKGDTFSKRLSLFLPVGFSKPKKKVFRLPAIWRVRKTVKIVQKFFG
jgi:hypothetical protein